jgi:tRNA modification GTPase
VLDEGMLVEMHAPRSYTGEDVVELHLHGSTTIVRRVIASCKHRGARAAEAGEFTLRAFLHGKLDLAQAEAVADLVGAASEAERAAAAAQLEGGLSRVLEAQVAELEGILAEWRAALDFPEHPTGDGWRSAHAGVVADVVCRIQSLVGSARVELSRGRHVVLCGAPNVGKSSLLNAWVGRERVLVDPAPGTTRDPVEVELATGLLHWSVWDTAGLRTEAEGLEARGIALSLERLKGADLGLWLVCPDAPVWPDGGLRVAVVGSKADLASSTRRAEVEAQARAHGLEFWGWISTRTGEGIADLRERIGRGLDAPLPADAIVVTRERHLRALEHATAALERVRRGAEQSLTLDVLAIELEDATKAIASILGRDVDAEVLEQIFSTFCIGK